MGGEGLSAGRTSNAFIINEFSRATVTERLDGIDWRI
jgi:hypothetical protein